MNSIPIEYSRLLDTAEVAERLHLPKAKERHKWGCPECGSSDALHVYPGPGRGSTCFSCSKSLDAIGLSMSAQGLDFLDAIKWLAAEFGFDDLIEDKGAQSILKAKRRLRAIREKMEARKREKARIEVERRKTARDVYDRLWPKLTLGRLGEEYLESRAIPAEVARHVGIRSVESMGEWEELAGKFWPGEFEAAGLVGRKEGDDYLVPWRAPFLVLPYWLEKGGVDVLRFRDLTGHSPKYLSPLGHAPQTPYLSHGAYDLADDYSTLYVCEGELNALSVLYAGAPAIGACGSSTWRAVWSREFKWFSKVIVLNDGDEAGNEFALSVYDATCKALGRDWADRCLEQQQFEGGLDANDALKVGGLKGVICG